MNGSDCPVGGNSTASLVAIERHFNRCVEGVAADLESHGEGGSAERLNFYCRCDGLTEPELGLIVDYLLDAGGYWEVVRQVELPDKFGFCGFNPTENRRVR